MDRGSYATEGHAHCAHTTHEAFARMRARGGVTRWCRTSGCSAQGPLRQNVRYATDEDSDKRRAVSWSARDVLQIRDGERRVAEPRGTSGHAIDARVRPMDDDPIVRGSHPWMLSRATAQENGSSIDSTSSGMLPLRSPPSTLVTQKPSAYADDSLVSVKSHL